MTANATSIVQHVIQMKNGIMKHFNVSVKLIVCAKLIIVGILAHVFVKMVFKVLLMIQKLCVMKSYKLWILYQRVSQVLFQ